MCFPVGPGGSDKRNVQSIDLSDFVDIDLGKNDLFGNPEGIISAPVKSLVANSAEVADTGNGNRYQAVEKLIHPVATQCDPDPDRHTFSEFEIRYILFGFGSHCFL